MARNMNAKDQAFGGCVDHVMPDTILLLTRKKGLLKICGGRQVKKLIMLKVKKRQDQGLQKNRYEIYGKNTNTAKANYLRLNTV